MSKKIARAAKEVIAHQNDLIHISQVLARVKTNVAQVAIKHALQEVLETSNVWVAEQNKGE